MSAAAALGHPVHGNTEELVGDIKKFRASGSAVVDYSVTLHPVRGNTEEHQAKKALSTR